MHINTGERRAKISEVRTLQGFISICCYCKKMKNEIGNYDQIEQYISEHTDTVFSHGIYPECFNKVKAELEQFK